MTSISTDRQRMLALAATSRRSRRRLLSLCDARAEMAGSSLIRWPALADTWRADADQILRQPEPAQ